MNDIDESNFSEYFRDLRTNTPLKGEVIAQYTAAADLVDGNEKRQIINLLTSTEGKMEATAQVMRKLLFASELDAYRIPRMMASDMVSGMSNDECATKPYRYTLEMFFCAKPEYVPKDDPHWSIISILNPEEISVKNGLSISSRIVEEDLDGGGLDTELVGDAQGGDAGSREASEDT